MSGGLLRVQRGRGAGAKVWRRRPACALLSPIMDRPRTQTSPKHLRLGELLRDARTAAGLRQAALAELLGRKQAFVSKYENGARGLDAVDFLAILDLLGADVGAVAEAMRKVDGD